MSFSSVINQPKWHYATTSQLVLSSVIIVIREKGKKKQKRDLQPAGGTPEWMRERERETCGVAGHFTRSRSVSRLMYSVLRNRSHTRMDRAPHPSVGINEERWKLAFGKQDVKLPGPPLPAHGFDLTTNPDLPRAPRHNCPLHSLNVRYTQGVFYIYIYV